MQFFYPWTTFIPKAFRRHPSRLILLEGPNGPSFSLTSAVREQHLSSTITATDKRPFLLSGMLVVQDLIKNLFQSYQQLGIIKPMHCEGRISWRPWNTIPFSMAFNPSP